jgi:hypothetical protein
MGKHMTADPVAPRVGDRFGNISTPGRRQLSGRTDPSRRRAPSRAREEPRVDELEVALSGLRPTSQTTSKSDQKGTGR